jgi:hypothetical protein
MPASRLAAVASAPMKRLSEDHDVSLVIKINTFDQIAGMWGRRLIMVSVHPYRATQPNPKIEFLLGTGSLRPYLARADLTLDQRAP